MGSKKRGAWAKQAREFKSQLEAGQGEPGLDDLFAQESSRRERTQAEHDAAVRTKACESKQRYASRHEAESTAAACEAHGSPKLYTYKCPYCGGWHLTHKKKVK